MVQTDDMVLAGLCSLLAFAISFYLLRLLRRRCSPADLQYPPGPRGLPIVGHLHMLGSLPHRSLAHLSRTHGPLLFLRLGSLPAIVASSPAMAKLILLTHDKIFSGRPFHFSMVRNVDLGYPGIGFCQPGPHWKLMRQLCFAEFFSAKRLEYFKRLRTEELRNLLLSLFAAEGAPIAIRPTLIRTAMNLISKMAIGRGLQELCAEGPNSEKTMEAVVELLKMVGEFNVSDYIPWLAWMDLQGYDRGSKRRAQLTRAVFQGEIDRRRRDHSSDEDPRDFLDVLLQAPLDPKYTELQIGDARIRSVLLDMFSAGSDTMSITIEWALTELLINPKKMKILQEELARIVGCSRLVQETDLPNLPYLQAVVNEIFRLHPPAPLLVPHMSLEASQIHGYHIPRHALVYVNAWAIHRDESIWDNPLEFSPERFLNTNVDELTQKCKFLPFGAGRRACPGPALGRSGVQYILANLIHAFDWPIPANPNLEEVFGLVVQLKEPLVIVPTPKLPKAALEILM